MTDPQPYNSASTPQGGTPWTNPMDAPPPFPNATPDYRTSNPYSSPNSYASTNQPSGFGALSQGYTGTPSTSNTNGDERLWAMLAHLSAPIATVISAGWLSILGPLIVYMAKKDSSWFVRNAASGAFNFMLSMWVMTIVGWLLTITVIFAIVGIPMILIGAFGSIVLGIVGAIKSWNGEAYVYPWQLRVLS